MTEMQRPCNQARYQPAQASGVMVCPLCTDKIRHMDNTGFLTRCRVGG